MQNSKKILTIAPYAFGYTDHIHNSLKSYDTVISSLLYLDKPSFQYRNITHKAQNFISKLFGKNLKKTFVFDRIKDQVSKLEIQDIIFIIRPDILDDHTLNYLKTRTKLFIAYYYDSTRRFPRKLSIVHFFDVIYSYDKIDVDRYNFKFLTNYIYEESHERDYNQLFFNISTYDYRFQYLELLAKYLKNNQWSYKILVYRASKFVSNGVEIITKQKSISEVSELMKRSKIVVEIQRTEQMGLSFRVFEALGHHKKLITTNNDIVNYDFYNPQNILVIDPENIEIPKKFVSSPYIDVDDSILASYRIEHWVNRVFNL